MTRFAYSGILTLLAIFLAPASVFAVTYDVVLSSSSLVVLPPKPHVGQLARVYVTAKSVGTLDVEGVAVFNDGETLIGRKAISLKANGAEEDAWTTWIPSTAGIHHLRVTVANDPGYPDASPENNRVELTVVVEGDPTPRPPASSTTTATTVSASSTTSGTSATTRAETTTSSGTPKRTEAAGEKKSNAPQETPQSTPAKNPKSVQPTRLFARNARALETAIPTIPVPTTSDALVTATAPKEMIAAVPETKVRIHANDILVDEPPRAGKVPTPHSRSLPIFLLWMGAAASAILALFFYMVSRRKTSNSE